MARPHRLVIFLAVMALVASVPATAGAGTRGLSIADAKKAAVAKVQRLQRKLLDTGAKSSAVPGCWRETRRSVGCLGMVRGEDELVRWRCAVPMTVRKRGSASASSHHRRIAVEFTDTMCSF
jgi:hypothetical protein